jgi:hypothetical protein
VNLEIDKVQLSTLREIHILLKSHREDRHADELEEILSFAPRTEDAMSKGDGNEVGHIKVNLSVDTVQYDEAIVHIKATLLDLEAMLDRVRAKVAEVMTWKDREPLL